MSWDEARRRRERRKWLNRDRFVVGRLGTLWLRAQCAARYGWRVEPS
jgi:hypothetical protein